MTPLDDILRIDQTSPRLTRLQERIRDRAAAASYLAKLNAGMRTYETYSPDQTLNSPDCETTAARIAYYTERVAKLDAIIRRDR